MNSHRFSKLTIRLLGCAMGLLLVGGVTPLWSASEEDMAFQLRADLELVLKAKADDLWNEKNEQGLHFQRGSYSKRFTKVDESTYQGLFSKDTASDDRMRTDAYRITLKASGSSWEISEEEHLGTYERLIREVPGDETFHRFDSFEFDHEGMHVTSGGGSMVIDFLLGEPSRVLITGDALSFEFTPPDDLGHQQTQVWNILKNEHPEDFSFTAEGVAVSCDVGTCKRFLGEIVKGLRDSTYDELDPALKDYFDKQLKRQREERKDNPFQGFQLPDEPDNVYYNAALKRKDKDQWITLSYDNYDPWEVNIYASDYGRLIGYPSEETRKSGADPYEIEQRDDYARRRYEVTGVDGWVEAGLDAAELLRAGVDFTSRLKGDAQEIPFFLTSMEDLGDSDRATGITVNSLEGADGQVMVYVKRGPTGGYVVLPEKAPAGTELLVRMEYETEGSIRKLTPTFSYVERGGWLPFISFTDRVEQFQLTVTAPAKFQTISVGSKVSETAKGDRVTTVWKAEGVTFPTIIFGDYNVDSPKTTASKFDGTEIPVTIYVDKDSMRSFGIPPKNLRPLASQAVNALNFYRERFGVDYPFGKLDLINSPAQGMSAQSPASIVYVGNPVFRSKSLLTGGTNATSTASFMDSVIAHEVAHQWFGAVVGNRNERSYWFVESLAEYASALYMEFVEGEGYQKPEKGRKAYLKMVDQWRKTILENDLMNSIQNSEVAYLGESYGRARQALIYNKGPYAFHILRETFGDEKMFAFLKALTTELAGKSIVTRDIQRVAEQSFGGTMEWFFDQWIRGIGIPQYSFNFEYRKAEDGTYVVQGKIKQRVVVGLKKYVLDDVYYRGIVPVVVLGRDGQEYRKGLLVEGAETDFAFKVPVEPTEITFNDGGEILAESVIYNLDF
jgi:hypothetical protein